MDISKLLNPIQEFKFRKDRGIKSPRFIGSQKKQESSRKTSTSASLHYTKANDCVNHKKMLKILEKIGIPDHLTCLMRKLYAGQEAKVRTRHGTMD